MKCNYRCNLIDSYHEQKFSSGFKNVVEERDCGGHVGDPVQAGEGCDQGEGGGVRGCEGAALGGVQPLEGHAGRLVVLAAVADHILGDVHPDHLSHAVQRRISVLPRSFLKFDIAIHLYTLFTEVVFLPVGIFCGQAQNMFVSIWRELG